MKKILVLFFAALLALVSCSKSEIDPLAPKKADPTGLVAVTMKLHIPVELQAQTKAVGDCSDQPSIKAIRVAVFGTSGYPQAYALAEPIKSATDESMGSYATTNGDIYYFKVLLPVYDGEAHVHVIANGDESIQFVNMNEAKIMETMYTTNNVGAYWARVIMPNGILTQLDSNGIMQTDDEGNYIPSAETAHLFKDLVLVRNFAEVVLDYQPVSGYDNLSDISWTLVNVPTKGSVAPMAAGTYVDNYKDYEYDSTDGSMKLGTMKYSGFMFTDEPMNYDVPAGTAITHSLYDDNDNLNPNFIYERCYPEEKPTCIMLKAKYKNQTDGYSYYRIDLMDEKIGGYYPILRNYKYTVTIKKVGNKGSSSPEEAMRHESGGNVSFTQEAQKLTDISDGTSRLYIEYIEKNFTSGGKKTFWVYYVPDVSHPTVMDNSKITVNIKPNTDNYALVSGTRPVKIGVTDDGWDIYQFQLNDQDEDKDLESTLQVIATNGETGDNKSTLYRDVKLRVMKKMDMTLSLTPPKATGDGAKTVLGIELPVGLPSSMFPLEMYIEDVNHVLAPTGYDHDGGSKITVPVKVEKSLADGTTNSYYYIRTVNEEEYTTSNIIQTEFKTNQANSGTTIYVANEYFKTHSINLLNEGIYVYPLNKTVNFNVTSVDVEVEMEDAERVWTVSGSSTDVNVVVLDDEEKPILDEDDNPVTSGKGTGKFRMTFPANNSTTATVKRTATVASSGLTDQIVTVTQRVLEFSLSPDIQTVAFNATSATVTVNAPEGKAWTATVSGPDEVEYSLDGADEEGKVSGEGQKTLTVIFDANSQTSEVSFTVTATMTDPASTTTATITQGRGPNPSSTFNVNSFSYNTNRTGSATSGDGFISISLSNLGLDYGNYGDIWDYNYRPTDVGYIQMGYRGNNQNNRGTITVTPAAGVKITQINVTYSTATYAGYEFGNNPVTVTPGEYNRDGNNSTTATWTGSSEGPVTFTNGFQNNTNSRNWPRITSIVVTYSAVD